LINNRKGITIHISISSDKSDLEKCAARMMRLKIGGSNFKRFIKNRFKQQIYIYIIGPFSSKLNLRILIKPVLIIQHECLLIKIYSKFLSY